MALRGNKILYKIFFKKYLNSYPNTFQYAEVNLSFVGVSVGEVVVVAAVVAVVKLIYKKSSFNFTLLQLYLTFSSVFQFIYCYYLTKRSNHEISNKLDFLVLRTCSATFSCNIMADDQFFLKLKNLVLVVKIHKNTLMTYFEIFSPFQFSLSWGLSMNCDHKTIHSCF